MWRLCRIEQIRDLTSLRDLTAGGVVKQFASADFTFSYRLQAKCNATLQEHG